ncbi:MAG: cupin domain-containing protein [Candidatus Binatia bacterium]
MAGESRFKAREAERIDKPWGFELVWAHATGYVGKLIHIDAGQALSYQYHRRKEETILVLRGVLKLYVSEDDTEPVLLRLSPGESFHIHSGLRHRFEAEEEVELVEASTPELDDVVRLKDRYGRAGT